MSNRGKGAAAQQQGPTGKTLPGREGTLFKQVLKLYEEKSYKKALKTSETILKKYPDHGETLAMKGLILNCFEKKKEAYEFVKKGLRNDISSPICWHVLGLLHRSDKEYAEAIKCYQQALKRDPKNNQILRDLSTLQVQTRDSKGLLDTRKQLLQQKPANRQNWIAYLVAAHLAGDLPLALKLIETYESTEEETKPFDVERSELLMYKTMLLEESGDIEGALNHINKNESLILDKVALREKRASFLLKLNRLEEATASYKAMLKINNDNYNYVRGLLQAANLDVPESERNPEYLEKVSKFFDELSAEYPKSQSVKVIPLSYLTGDKFKARLEDYLKAGLRKGVPSLFNSVKSLYKSKERTQIIEDVVLGYYNSIKETGKLPNQDQKETPVTLLWTLHFLAKHFDLLKNYKRALEFIEEAISHTPTALDLYLTKGKIFKHAGDIKKASELYDTARKLDLADRYLNTKSTLYFIRADDVETADKTIILFTREGETSGNTTLFDMQCMWYELESGESFLRTKRYGMALKRFLQVEKHFADFIEDQLDFHSYCLRKMTLRSYLNLLRFEDNLYAHKNFLRASCGIIRAYLAIYDAPKETTKASEDEFAGLSESERKKAINKKNRQLAREKAEQEAKKTDNKQLSPLEVKKAEEEKEAEGLEKVADPLAEATKYVTKALQSIPKNLELQLLAVEVYIRRSKFLLALKALRKASALAPGAPSVHRATVKFLQTFNSKSSTVNPTVKEVVESEGKELLGGKSLQDFNQSYLEQHKTSAEHRYAVADSLLLLDSSKKSEAVSLLSDTSVEGLTYSMSVLALESLQSIGDEKAVESFKQKARELFPHGRSYAVEAPQQTNGDTKEEAKQ